MKKSKSKEDKNQKKPHLKNNLDVAKESEYDPEFPDIEDQSISGDDSENNIDSGKKEKTDNKTQPVYSSSGSLPVIHGESGLAEYIREIQKFPILTPEEEERLAIEYYENKNIEAAHALVTSHLRLVVKTAFEYKGYGLPINDIISEGNIGLMKALKKFNPYKGFRLSTYALWWVKATIHEFILNSWSLVKIGTAATQKKLFFNLRRLKNKLGIFHDKGMNSDEIKQIAQELDVSEKEVQDMDSRMGMGRESSLNTYIGDENKNERIDLLTSNEPDQEELFAEQEQRSQEKDLLKIGMQSLNDREKYVIEKRRLADPPLTLEDLGQELNISRERVRQIENKAFEKLQKNVKKQRTEELKSLRK